MKIEITQYDRKVTIEIDHEDLNMRGVLEDKYLNE